MNGRNVNLLQNIQEHWSIKLYEDIQFQYVKNIFRMSFLVTSDTFSRLIHLKLIHNRVMTNKILLKMNLADSSTCLSCNRKETVVHAFLDCENVTRFWRSIECWIRRVIDRNFKLSYIDKIFGTLRMNNTTNTVILSAQEIIYRNRQIGGTLVLAQVRRKLYNQMIKENLLAKFSLDQQNFHKKWNSIEDDLCS